MTDKEEVNYKELAESFYHACGGTDGCGDLDGVDYLCHKYAHLFEEEEDEE